MAKTTAKARVKGSEELGSDTPAKLTVRPSVRKVVETTGEKVDCGSEVYTCRGEHYGPGVVTVDKTTAAILRQGIARVETDAARERGEIGPDEEFVFQENGDSEEEESDEENGTPPGGDKPPV